MKKWFIVVLFLALLPSCKGDNNSTLLEDMLTKKPEVSIGVDVIIVGKVICEKCHDTDSMMLSVWDRARPQERLVDNMPSDFGNGEFKIETHTVRGAQLQIDALLSMSGVPLGPYHAQISVPDDQDGVVISDVIIQGP